MTIQGTRTTRWGQRGHEGPRGGGGRDNIIPRILSHQRGSWGWWGERRLVHESRCTKPLYLQSYCVSPNCATPGVANVVNPVKI